MPMSLQLSLAIANLIASNTPVAAFSGPNRYLALHHTDPTKSCLVGELANDNYSRILIPLSIMDIAKGKGVVNDSVLVFPIASGTKIPTINFGSVWDSASGGTPITYGALSTPANWTAGVALSLGINAFIQLIRNTV